MRDDELTRRITTLEDAEQYLSLPKTERGEEPYEAMLVEQSLDAAIHAFDEAYDTEFPGEKAEQYFTVFTTAFQDYYSIGDASVTEADIISLAAEMQNDFGTPPQPADTHLDPLTGMYTHIHHAFTQEYDADRFDYLAGIHSSGLPLLATATPYFTGEPVILRFSHRKRSDNTVHTTDATANQATFTGADVLLLDDQVATGQTIGETSHYLFTQGADTVKAVQTPTPTIEYPVYNDDNTVTVEDPFTEQALWQRHL